MRFARWTALEGYLEAEGNSSSPIAVLYLESSVGCCFDGRVVRCDHWGDVYRAQKVGPVPVSLSQWILGIVAFCYSVSHARLGSRIARFGSRLGS